MKTLLFSTLMTVAFTAAIAQQTVENFTKISSTGNVKITVVNGDAHTLTFPDNKPTEGVEYKVSGGILSINGSKAKETADIKITAPVINEIELKTVSELYTEGVFIAPQLKLTAEGASELHMDLQSETLSIEMEGAAEAWLNGTATTCIAQLKGASEVHASSLKTKTADISTEGAAAIDIAVEESLKAHGSGASEIKYIGEPANVDVLAEGVADIGKKGETVVEIEIEKEFEFGSDSACNNDCDEDNDFEFNGHWAGVDLMMNNFISKYGDLNTAPGYNFMELEFAKSIGVSLNFMEFNIPFVETDKVGFGLTTGLGLTILNYRLGNDVRLINDSAVLMAYSDTISNTIRSKLTTSYLMMPLMFEFNTKGQKHNDAFHFGVGAFGGVRVGSHSKVVIDDRGDKDKFKSDGNFHLNPFKYGVMVRMGWRNINLFANYALSEMFEKNEGPAVYPVEFGLSFDIN